MQQGRLNSYTNSFIKLKKQTQDTFEFSVLVCNAIPNLKRTIRLFEKGIVTDFVKPDYFGGLEDLTEDEKFRQKEQLKENAADYKSKLSKYILISNFSFFEAYIIDVLNEMIDFHGGRDNFVAMCSKRGLHQMRNDSSDIESIRRRIRRPNNFGHIMRYKSATKSLQEKGYRFPSDLLSNFGAKMLLQKISNLSAKDIPAILTDGLHMELSDSLVLDFHNAREIRNKIAHGESLQLTISQVSNISKTLRNIAMKVDQHLLRYYFISEKYIHV